MTAPKREWRTQAPGVLRSVVSVGATVERLVAKSMLVRRPGNDGATRLAMLEPIREYAAERLAARPDAAAVEHRHGRYFLELAETAEPHLMGPDQVAWGRRFDAEAANVRRALAQARASGDVELVLRLFSGISEWWSDRGLWSEARGWLEWALDCSDERVPHDVRAAAWHALAYLLWPDEDSDRVLDALDRSWELYRTTDNKLAMAHSQILRAFTQLARDDVDAARTAAAKAVRLAEGVDEGALGLALRVLAETESEPAAARRTVERAADHLERAGDLRALSRMWEDLSYNALVAGEVDEARALVERCLALRDELDDLAESVTALAISGVVALESGDDGSARQQLHAALARYRTHDIKPGLSWVLLGLAVISAREGASNDAGRLVGAATAVRSTRAPVDRLEQRLEAAARAAAVEACGADAWEESIAAGLRLDPRERIELGLRSSRL